MEVIRDIKGKVYEDLVRYASKRCDAVMLTFCKSPFRGDDILVLNETKNNVKKQFKNSILKTRNCDYSILVEYQSICLVEKIMYLKFNFINLMIL